MTKYRKLPVVIEAYLFDGTSNGIPLDLHTTDYVDDLVSHNLVTVNEGTENSYTYLSIPTLEGYMRASVGDYIIKGVNGEYYPCKPDIFHKTYELVEE